MDDFAESKKWKAIVEIERREEVGAQLPTIQEEGGNDSGRRFRKRGNWWR